MYTLANNKVKIAFDQRGNLIELTNLHTQRNYAGGYPIWRLFFQSGEKFDLEAAAGASCPEIHSFDDHLVIKYDQISFEQKQLNISIELCVLLKDDNVYFDVKLHNNEPGIIVRDFHYPVIHDLKIHPSQFLITSCNGGMKYDNPRKEIRRYHTAYIAKDHNFIQKKTVYPNNVAATNNFLFADDNEGIYFGLHSGNIEYTNHNFRLYGDVLDVSVGRFPNCETGDKWQQDGYVISPYSGSWHVAAKKYRSWAEATWFKPHDIPQWVSQMTGWQRIIMKHQYGEIHYTFDQLPQIREEGNRSGVDAFFMFGWQKGGHDNNYPEYVPDNELGSDEEMKCGIANFNDNEGAVILYSNGQLIDKDSKFYKEQGQAVSIRDFRGNEIQDGYYFQTDGNFYNNFAARSFVHACPYCEQWETVLEGIVDTAFDFGCKAVFFDQLGRGSTVCWSAEHGHAVGEMSSGIQRAKQVSRLRKRARSKSQDMAVGVEILCDIIAAEADFVHSNVGFTKAVNDWEGLGEKPKSEFFGDWFRYIFPEIIISDREIRDDSDIERRVNHTVLKGLRNDVEIYRCRKTIAETPNYQEYLGKTNRLKVKYSDLLLAGIYRDTVHFSSTNDEIDVRCFVNGKRMAIVAAQSHLEKDSTEIEVPGYKYIEHDGITGFDVCVQPDKLNVTLEKHGLAVIILEQE